MENRIPLTFCTQWLALQGYASGAGRCRCSGAVRSGSQQSNLASREYRNLQQDQVKDEEPSMCAKLCRRLLKVTDRRVKHLRRRQGSLDDFDLIAASERDVMTRPSRSLCSAIFAIWILQGALQDAMELLGMFQQEASSDIHASRSRIVVWTSTWQ